MISGVKLSGLMLLSVLGCGALAGDSAHFLSMFCGFGRELVAGPFCLSCLKDNIVAIFLSFFILQIANVMCRVYLAKSQRDTIDLRTDCSQQLPCWTAAQPRSLISSYLG
ncbi:hypothetical protein B0T25DRAFT_321478 [Lasiosphaeria hispida]|uniref:Uncharacterized protein n=1 Tax=Lasiosphaeria hispida TaxID=260671 RepID=A0AAJ0HA58_9PEZI|nr:hypothetical protein B0T25DRAFT_321478 [Lasiosphaeria hispida]